MKNNTYYAGKNGSQIMNTNNFSKEIVRYLNYEQAYISKILSKYIHGTLIELGCDEVRLYGCSAMNEVNYIGVDIRGSLKPCIDDYLSKNSHVKGKFIHSCLSDFYELLNIELVPILCVFPFNLIGNLNECKSQINNCYLHGFDVVISQFNTTDKAKEIRLDYYKKCGIPHIFLKKTNEGDIFKGLDFESKSYNKNFIIESCINVGFNHIDSYESELISIHYFSKRVGGE